MKTWVEFLIRRRLSFMVYTVLVALIPIYLLAGIWFGCCEVFKDWKADWRDITKAAARTSGEAAK